MKQIRSIKNQYRGINAHLHSLWQAKSGWSGFHARHIVHIADVLAAQLIPMGYVAEIEDSLQIRRAEGKIDHMRGDVTIYDADPLRAQPASSQPQTPGQWQPIPELLSEEEFIEKPLRALSIYAIDPITQERSEPVAWIELLSPSNKGGNQDAEAYRAKRMELMVNGLVFVEIDYLHETPPTFINIPIYPASADVERQSDAHPYRIIVLNPRPKLEKGRFLNKAFDVDEPIPVVEIPLKGGDLLEFDFGAPYRKTFEDGLVGYHLDYSEFPLNFRRYSATDQTRIALRMLAVIEAAQTGTDLETAPFPLKNLPLDVALKRIEVQLQKG